MQLETLRFGMIEIDENRLITFHDGIPGLEKYRSYALLQFSESYPIIWLQSSDDGSICLPVLDTYAVLSEYVFDIDDDDVKTLKLNRPDELHVVSVLVIPDDIQQMTANLAAPILINTTTRVGKQIVLTGSDYNVRFPVFQDICRVVSREEDEADAGTVKEAQ